MKYSIDEKSTIIWDKNKYYLRIRSCNKDNPIVLFLHGGCGSPDRAQVMKYQSTLAKDFTLVCWDQRGAGLAYDKHEAKTLTLTKELYVEDAHNVVSYLKNRFHKNKIIIVGHSFGSVLGVWLAQKYPQDIEAYVGVGQCVDYVKNEELSYDWAFRHYFIKSFLFLFNLFHFIIYQFDTHSFNFLLFIYKITAIFKKLFCRN